MIRLLVLRHGITAWNTARRLQGRRDVALDAAGRALVAGWRLPDDFARAPVLSSPLARCVETAAILAAGHPGLGPVATDDRLMEKSWGVWEGRTLAEMEAALGAHAHAAGHRPEGGESRAELAARVADLLAGLAAAGAPDTVVVAHRGVIRALYALATGWDHCGETPVRLSRRRAQLFALAPDGTPAVEALNLRLAAPAAAPR